MQIRADGARRAPKRTKASSTRARSLPNNAWPSIQQASAHGRQGRRHPAGFHRVPPPCRRGIRANVRATIPQSTARAPLWKKQCGNAKRETSMARLGVEAGIPPGCIRFARVVRWYRFAQPPANRLDAFGILNAPVCLARHLPSTSPLDLSLSLLPGIRLSP